MSNQPATTAPEQTYPEITPAPPASDAAWTPAADEIWTGDRRGTIAPEATYPEAAPAEPYVERAPVALSPAAYIDPGSSKFGQALVASLVNAGLMDPL